MSSGTKESHGLASFAVEPTELIDDKARIINLVPINSAKTEINNLLVSVSHLQCTTQEVAQHALMKVT